MRGSRLFVITSMVVFGTIGIGLLVFFFTQPDDSGRFNDNLVPELIGFCLEGFFLVGVLTMLQTSREHAYRKELWLSLRGALRGFLSKLDIALLPPHAEPARTAVLETDPMIVRRFLRELKAGRLELESMVALKKESIDVLGLARDMIPVAAQLSARHMRWWIAIVNSIRQLSQAQSRDAVEQAVNLLLENINEFDNVNY
jgi:hypothetical protein